MAPLWKRFSELFSHEFFMFHVLSHFVNSIRFSTSASFFILSRIRWSAGLEEGSFALCLIEKKNAISVLYWLSLSLNTVISVSWTQPTVYISVYIFVFRKMLNAGFKCDTTSFILLMKVMLDFKLLLHFILKQEVHLLILNKTPDISMIISIGTGHRKTHVVDHDTKPPRSANNETKILKN